MLATGRNAGRIERDYRDIRLDYADHYFVFFPGRGLSLVTQNEQAMRLGVGDAVIVDTTCPVKLFAENNSKGPWSNFAINLPRRELAAHLGFEPQGASMRPDETRASLLPLELSQSANEEPLSESLSANSYMQLVVYQDPMPVRCYERTLEARTSISPCLGFYKSERPDWGPDDRRQIWPTARCQRFLQRFIMKWARNENCATTVETTKVWTMTSICMKCAGVGMATAFCKSSDR